VLVTARPASLLVTIRSRCQRVTFAPLGEAVIVERLMGGHGLGEAAAHDAAALAQGSLGRALALATSEEFPRRRKVVRAMVEAARGGKPTAMLDAAAELGGDREEALAILELLWVTYRDALVVAGGLDAGAAALGGSRRETAAWLAGSATVPGLLKGLHAIVEAKEAIEGNVSPQLAVEALLLGLGRARAA
jgi:DNA polymerase-3 subunit delta'